jgi:hypothetical protein
MDPESSVIGTDPRIWIRIRIRFKKSRIWNIAFNSELSNRFENFILPQSTALLPNFSLAV